MTPLERAARALCSLDGNPENATMDGKPLWQDYLPEVRAVVAAIREPSEAMIDAAQNEAWAAGTSIRRHEIEGFFGAMIYELLREDRA